jgi:ADP-heptose:LPS heptosyltransferase
VENARVPALETFDSIHSWYGAGRPDFRDAVRHLRFEFFPALPPPPGIPRVQVPPAPIEDFAIIHPFASSGAKRWPLENFRSVADGLGVPMRWCAGPDEELPSAFRTENLYDLARWLSTARLYIGNDSGITHLAAAVGIPVVAIFGATDPAVWAPRGDRVRVVSGNLDEISLEQVLNAVASVTA